MKRPARKPSGPSFSAGISLCGKRNLLRRSESGDALRQASPLSLGDLAGHTLNDSMRPLLLELQRQLREQLLVVGVGVVRLPIPQELGVPQRSEGHVVHVDQERPAAVLATS